MSENKATDRDKEPEQKYEYMILTAAEDRFNELLSQMTEGENKWELYSAPILLRRQDGLNPNHDLVFFSIAMRRINK